MLMRVNFYLGKMRQTRTFNTEGPCNPLKHYMVDALRGMGGELSTLVEGGKYFVIHAARQSGKTTVLRSLAAKLIKTGKYYALYCSLETLEGVDDAAVGIPAILDTVKNALINYSMPKASSFGSEANMNAPYGALQSSFVAYCRSLDKPFVLLIDEADCLSGATLISFLRQLRSGYVNRDDVPFIAALALTGMRDIRDYRNDYRQPSQTLGSSSPFNVVAATMSLNNFTRDEIGMMYGQYTEETNRSFSEDAVDFIWEQTQGQPWLVNAIARNALKLIKSDDFYSPINIDIATVAVQSLITGRETHFDSLAARLHETRVQRIIEPIITGKKSAISRNSDDYGYVRDMGLIRDDKGQAEPANPIYGEIIVRALNRDVQEEIDAQKYQIPVYIKNNAIDMDSLLCDFQIFWRENEEIWHKKYDYQEAAPQLILQAFLQRVINGGGSISREMAAAAGRVDLCVAYCGNRYPIELKIKRDESTYAKGVEQILSYMDKLGCKQGWLVIFDRSKNIPWDKKLYKRMEVRGDNTVTVFGC